MPKYTPGVHIAIPNYRGVVVQRLAGWLFTQECAPGETLALDMHAQQPVDACRNTLVQHFLMGGNIEWMVMIDDDIVPWPTLLEMRHLGLPIVSALTYTRKNGIPIACAATARRGNWTQMGGISENQDKPVEVVGVGTGALMIHRSVFEKIKPPWFRFTYKDNGASAQGEDFYFSQKAKKAGYKLYVDTTKACGHVHLADVREMGAQLQLAIDSKSTDEFQDKLGFQQPMPGKKPKAS